MRKKELHMSDPTTGSPGSVSLTSPSPTAGGVGVGGNGGNAGSIPPAAETPRPNGTDGRREQARISEGFPGLAVVAFLIAYLAVGIALALKGHFITLGAYGVLLVILAAGTVIIPNVHFGVVQRFSKRTGRILKEGIHLVIPFFDEVLLIEQLLKNKPLEVKVTSKDELPIEIVGSIQYRAASTITDAQGRNRFVEMDETVIENGINDAVEAELGIIAGLTTAEDFIQERAAVGLLIACILNLETPPHVREKVEPANRLKYYIDHLDECIEELQTHSADKHSAIEERYGIDIVAFTLSRVKFDEATEAALKAKKDAELFTRSVDSFDAKGSQHKVSDAFIQAGKGTLKAFEFRVPGLAEGIRTLVDALAQKAGK